MPEGRRRQSRSHRQPHGVDAPDLRHRRKRSHSAEDAVQLRRVGLGVLAAADDRRPMRIGLGGSRPRPGRAVAAGCAASHYGSAMRAVVPAGSDGDPIRRRYAVCVICSAAAKPCRRRSSIRRCGIGMASSGTSTVRPKRPSTRPRGGAAWARGPRRRSARRSPTPPFIFSTTSSMRFRPEWSAKFISAERAWRAAICIARN